MTKIADMSDKQLLGLLRMVNDNMGKAKRSTTMHLVSMEKAIRASDLSVWPETLSLPYDDKSTAVLFRDQPFMLALYEEARTRVEALPGYAALAAAKTEEVERQRRLAVQWPELKEWYHAEWRRRTDAVQNNEVGPRDIVWLDPENRVQFSEVHARFLELYGYNVSVAELARWANQNCQNHKYPVELH